MYHLRRINSLRYALIFLSIFLGLGSAAASAENTTAYFFHQTQGYAISPRYAIGSGNKLITPVLASKEYYIRALKPGKREIWIGESKWGGGRVGAITLRPNATQFFIYGAKRSPTALKPLGGHVYIQEIPASQAKALLKTFKRIQ